MKYLDLIDSMLDTKEPILVAMNCKDSNDWMEPGLRAKLFEQQRLAEEAAKTEPDNARRKYDRRVRKTSLSIRINSLLHNDIKENTAAFGLTQERLKDFAQDTLNLFGEAEIGQRS